MSSARAASMSDDHEKRSLTEPGAAVVILAEVIEHGDPGGVNCMACQFPAPCEVGVQPPSQAFVEVLGAIDVGHRNDDDLELEIDGCRGGSAGGLFTGHLCRTHGDLRAGNG